MKGNGKRLGNHSQGIIKACRNMMEDLLRNFNIFTHHPRIGYAQSFAVRTDLP